MKISVLPAVALAIGSVMTTACGQEEPTVQEGPQAPAGIEAGNARLMLAAVKGNPAVVYFDVANNSERTTVIRAVSVLGSGDAMLHQTTEINGQSVMGEIIQVNLQAGESVSFEPGGLHVMLMEPAETLVAGGEAELTVTFVGGDKVSIPAEIREAGDER